MPLSAQGQSIVDSRDSLPRAVQQMCIRDRIEVFDIVQRAVDIISSTLAEGDRVVIRNFGTFQVKEVKPKVGRNPKNPDQDVPIPARSVVKFKVGKESKDQVAKLTASK